jgi:hypothetical protein
MQELTPAAIDRPQRDYHDGNEADQRGGVGETARAQAGSSRNQAIGRYIDGFYNPVRRHSALDFTSPAQFEKMAAE